MLCSIKDTLLFSESPCLVLGLLLIGIIFKNNKAVLLTISLTIMILMIFYRFPKRNINHQSNNVIVSPCDGKVLSIKKVNDKYTRIVIYLSIFNVHTQWYPCSGKIKKVVYKPGKFNLAHILEKSEYNERVQTTIDAGLSNDIGVVQIAGQVARRIVNKSKTDETVTKGSYMGMIKLSSRVDVYLPNKGLDLRVVEGQDVRGCETNIAEYIKPKK